MRVWLSRLLLLVVVLGCGAVLAPDRGAIADTVGGFTFTAPAGFEVCKDPPNMGNFQQYFCASNNAIIAIQSPAAGTDSKSLANSDLEGIEIVNEQEATFAGKAGHVVIGRLAQGDKFIFVAVAATTDAGGARIALIAAPEVVEESVQAWSNVIDQGSFGAPPAATQTFTIKNVGEGCTATAMIDGQPVEIAAGGSTEVKLSEGKHEFTWQDSDGSTHSATADVPPADTLGASCAVGGTTEKKPPQTEIPVANNADTAMFNGARAAVKFYRILGNILVGKELLSPEPKSDRPMLRILTERPDDRLGTMHEYSDYVVALEAAMAAAQNDPNKMATLRRLAVIMLAGAGQIGGVSDACNTKAGPELLDCVVSDFEGAAPRAVVSEWGRTFARIGNAPNPTDGYAELQKLAQ